MSKENILFECRNINKTFPGVKALTDINFSIAAGEIHGLIGANGAGKSTLMKIISGVYNYDRTDGGTPESGLYLKGRRVEFKGPAEAIENKIILIHQELNVIPDMTVYENIFINSQKRKHGLLDKKAMIRETEELIARFGADINYSDRLRDLPVDKQKLVEVLKAISLDAEILIMDEPSSMLTTDEAEQLFDAVKTVAEKSRIGVVLISHNLKEIKQICHRVTVLRDGRWVGSYPESELSIESMVELMLGRSFVKAGRKTEQCIRNERLLKVENLGFKNRLHDINLSLNRGEILGITGLVGSGGSVLAKVLFGCEGYRKSCGKVTLKDRVVEISNPSEAISQKMALLTEDRKLEGLLLKFKIFENITLPSLGRYLNKVTLLDRKARRKAGAKYFPLLAIKANGPETVTETLSGGNQQKVVIAKWLETDPEILIFCEPTIGIDVGAKNEIRKLISDLAAQGKGIILITEEVEELQSLCDKVHVMFRGRIIEDLSGERICEKTILKYALGGK